MNMSEVSDDEINRVIAEYMDNHDLAEALRQKIICQKECSEEFICIHRMKITQLTFGLGLGSSRYSESIDSLEPVVEKINQQLNAQTPFATRVQLNITNETSSCLIQSGSNFIARVKGERKPSRALALACYRVIKEMSQQRRR